MKKGSILFLFISLFLIISLRLGFSFENEVGSITALSGVVLDVKTGTLLYAKNPQIKIPPASTVKLLTAMVVLDRLSLNQKVRISKNAENIPSTPFLLHEGEVYTVEDLLNLMLIKSSNQAAVALAEAVSGREENFVQLMNLKAHALGLKNSKFQTASGLPAPDQYTTAYELALLLYEALKYPKIVEIINTPLKIITNEDGRTIIVKNTNHLLFEEDYKDSVLGGKTGYTRLSKHCLVNVAKIKDRMVITSLLGAPSREALWEDTKRMLKFAELVLDNKISPIYLNTFVDLSQPVNHVYSVKKRKPIAKNKTKKQIYLAKTKKKIHLAKENSATKKHRKLAHKKMPKLKRIASQDVLKNS